MRNANEERKTVDRKRWGLFHVLGRNIWLFLLILLLTPGITAIYSYLYVPRPYRAYTTFEIHTPDSNANPGETPSDTYLNTKVALIESRSMLYQVIDSLNLEMELEMPQNHAAHILTSMLDIYRFEETSIVCVVSSHNNSGLAYEVAAAIPKVYQRQQAMQWTREKETQIAVIRELIRTQKVVVENRETTIEKIDLSDAQTPPSPVTKETRDEASAMLEHLQNTLATRVAESAAPPKSITMHSLAEHPVSRDLSEVEECMNVSYYAAPVLGLLAIYLAHWFCSSGKPKPPRPHRDERTGNRFRTKEAEPQDAC